jgi:outer membrane protein OmpA-like peptidoglycan-associated protein
MKRKFCILTGTALATLMASAAGNAFSAESDPTSPTTSIVEPATAILLAQADGQPVEELIPGAPAEPEAVAQEEAKPRIKKKKRNAPEPEAAQPAAPEAPQAEAPREQEPAPAKPAKAKRQAEAPEPAEPEQPKRKKKAQEAVEQPAAPKAEKPRAVESQAEAPRPKKPKRETSPGQAAQPQAEAAPEDVPQAEPEQPKRKKKAQEAVEQPEAPQAEAAPEVVPQAEPEQPKRKKKAQEAVEQPEAPQAEETEAKKAPAPKPAKEAPEAVPQQAAPAEQAPGAQPQAEQTQEQPQAPAADEPAATEAQTPAEVQPAPAKPKKEAESAAPAEAPVRAKAPNDGKKAPALDSQKELPAPPAEAGQAPEAPARKAKAAEPEAPPPPPVPAGPPPQTDEAAQEAVKPAKVQPVTAEEGRRRESQPADQELVRSERPAGLEVLREIGDRVIVEINNQVIVESNDRPRMSRGAREVYYEDLPHGRTRETIVRADGTRVVTVRNAYGDIIRRSRIMPDEHEYVLVYVEEDDYDRLSDWRDPGLYLPPLQLDIPEDEYILDAAAVEEPEVYYEFLEQPPVERVERYYSVDEVKRSARIRDKTRRIDLDTLTFDFGQASIPEDQIPRLEAVAQAMEKLLAENPAETFLIEGHTDAVGSDLANLALSDRRAEAVADALTNVFAIPPENLSTQGYGEQYLKVRTQAPEPENRRVAIRRITPLVAPVVSQN